MRKLFVVLALIGSINISNAEATCYQASKCVVPFLPSLNVTLGDLDCFFRINTQARAAGREVRQAIQEAELRHEAGFNLDVQMVGADPIPNMTLTVLPNIVDAQCD